MPPFALGQHHLGNFLECEVTETIGIALESAATYQQAFVLTDFIAYIESDLKSQIDDSKETAENEED